MIKLENMWKYYGDYPAVIDVSAEILQGEVHASQLGTREGGRGIRDRRHRGLTRRGAPVALHVALTEPDRDRAPFDRDTRDTLRSAGDETKQAWQEDE